MPLEWKEEEGKWRKIKEAFSGNSDKKVKRKRRLKEDCVKKKKIQDKPNKQERLKMERYRKVNKINNKKKRTKEKESEGGKEIETDKTRQ